MLLLDSSIKCFTYVSQLCNCVYIHSYIRAIREYIHYVCIFFYLKKSAFGFFSQANTDICDCLELNRYFIHPLHVTVLAPYEYYRCVLVNNRVGVVYNCIENYPKRLPHVCQNIIFCEIT